MSKTELEIKQAARIAQLEDRITDIESDIVVAVKAIGSLNDKLGIDTSSLSKGDDENGGAIGAALPVILNGLIGKLMTGAINEHTLADLIALSPMLKKYEYLMENKGADE